MNLRILFVLLFLAPLPALLLPGCQDSGSVSGPPVEPDPPVPCTFGIPVCRERVVVEGGFLLPVYRTHPLEPGDTLIRRAVFVVHGTNRNADDYFETMVGAVREVGGLGETLVIAPRFQTLDDWPATGEPAWTSGGWKRGDPTVVDSPEGVRISSYAALDGVLAVLADRTRFPNLTKIVITGHSAGGQYTHRFAAGSPAEGRHGHLAFRYVVANPSTYLYLGPQRSLAGGGFGLPDREACPTYNTWHYGLEELNPYMARLSVEEIRRRLGGRDVVYLVGTEDTGTHLLDMSCGAMLQGSNRFARGLTLFAFMNEHFPAHGHRLHEVAGVGHSSGGIYTSATGMGVLFSW